MEEKNKNKEQGQQIEKYNEYDRYLSSCINIILNLSFLNELIKRHCQIG